ncbi:hypothetical protein ACQEU6_30290 [Spirillospora sp. CA-108201]
MPEPRDARRGRPLGGGSEYSVVMAPCGGPNQVWKPVRFAPSVHRLANGDGYYLQASWSGLKPVTLKPSSYAAWRPRAGPSKAPADPAGGHP